MAQDDYHLPNSSGAAFRQNLNAALGAIQSVNSGNQVPSDTSQYMYWIDENVSSSELPLLKQRNKDDDGNILLAEINGQSYFSSGSADKPGIAFRDDKDCGMQRNTVNKISLVTNGANRLTIDGSGLVGIGVTGPSELLHVNGNIKATGVIFIGETGNPEDVTDSTANPEKVKIKNNQISINGNNNASLLLNRTEADGAVAKFFRSGGSNNSNNPSGSISVNNNATAYNTSSDYRLKENVVVLNNGISRVKQLLPKRFNFIADAETTVDGFIAHEAQTVVPEAVTGTRDEVDENGNPVMQGIDQSKLVPLLTAALQEAIAKIETLEAKVAALEAGN